MNSSLTPISDKAVSVIARLSSRLGINPRALARDDRGAAIVELALVLPILMMVLVGIVQFGVFFTQAVAISNAAHNGARYASVHPAAWSSAATPAANTIQGQILVSQNPTNLPNDDSHININYLIVTGSTATTCGHYSVSSGGFVGANGYSQATCLVAGSMIQVTVTYTYAFSDPFIHPWLPNGITFPAGASILEEV